MTIREQIDKRLRNKPQAHEVVTRAAMECKHAAHSLFAEHGEAAKRLEKLAGEIYHIALDLTPDEPTR